MAVPRLLHVVMLGVLLVVAACKADEPVVAKPLPQSVIELVVDGRATPLRVAVEVADTDAARERGLMMRDHLAPDSGMLFVWPVPGRHAFWMKNTMIPLDMIFILQGKVVAVIPWAKPYDETPLDPQVDSDMVLEVVGGWASAHGVASGVAVRFPAVP